MDEETSPEDYHAPAWLGVQPGAAWAGLVAGGPMVGLWCEKCLLPSRYEVPLYVLDDDGPVRIGTYHHCDGGCEA